MEDAYITLALLAHVDAGKTTATEQLLYHTGALRQPGSVDRGTASTDWLEVERQRGISVRSAQTRFASGNKVVNLIDTPGHTDFADEVERALSVLDAAVLVVSAAEGVQASTRVLWEACQALRLPVILFINKCDRTGCDPGSVAEELGELAGSPLIPLNAPGAPGSREVSFTALSDAALTERVADVDEAVADRYLSDLPCDRALLSAALARACARQEAFPLVYGAAMLGGGIDCLRDAILGLLPFHPLCPEGEPAGVVYKVEHDPKMGKVCYLRLDRGTLRNRDAVSFPQREQEEKITQIRAPFGARSNDTGLLRGGEVAAVCGLTSARVGDTIGDFTGHRYTLATPLFTVRALPSAPDKLSALVAAMQELADENPHLGLDWEPETRELRVRILGAIQLEVLGELLQERYGLSATFTPPTVIYKETPAREGIGFEAYTMPKPCWAVIKLQIEPGERGSGLVYRSVIGDREILSRYQHHIETTVPEALRQGLFGWEVTDLRVTLIGGQHHLIHTHPLDFFLATPMAVMNGLDNCGTLVLEPLNLVRLTFDESLLGRVTGDLLSMRGLPDTPVSRRGQVTLEAELPVATGMDYPVRFASLTHGQGRYASRYLRYALCPDSPPPSTPRRGIDPRDRSRWILAHRGAIT